MSLFQKFLNFLKKLIYVQEEPVETEVSFEESAKPKESAVEYRLNLGKKTLLTRLYTIEQKITVFETEFPKEFQEFTRRINILKEDYLSSLKNINEELTFEIDPDDDGEKLGLIGILDSEVDKFIETEVKFNITSKSLQKLIIILNNLYNASIVHFKADDKVKVISQVDRGVETAKRLSSQFKNSYYIVNNKELKETIVTLLAYVDFLIFKIKLRNSSCVPNELLQESIMLSEFNNFDYVTALRDFIKDEISDLHKLLPLLKNQEYMKLYDKKIKKLLRDLTYSFDEEDDQIFSIEFWNNYFSFESSYLQILKEEGVESEIAKVKILEKMNISIDENEVWVLPVTTAYLALTNLFSTTRDMRLVVVNRMLKNICKDITYKEIYYLLILFDVIDIVVYNSNDLLRHIDKYIKRNSYSRQTINEKKEKVKNMPNKEFVFIFEVGNNDFEIIQTLQNLNFDFFVDNNKVYLNHFYFNGLKNVSTSLQNNTNNII